MMIRSYDNKIDETGQKLLEELYSVFKKEKNKVVGFGGFLQSRLYLFPKFRMVPFIYIGFVTIGRTSKKIHIICDNYTLGGHQPLFIEVLRPRKNYLVCRKCPEESNTRCIHVGVVFGTLLNNIECNGEIN